MKLETTDFLVVGAGLGGLAFAEDVVAQGATVRLLDKGRGVGGRAATRRLGGSVRADHGAQYFTARGERFKKIVDQGIDDGWIAIWNRGLPLWKNGEITHRPEGHPRYAPPGGMSDLPKQLAKGLDITLSAAVNRISRDEQTGDWTAHCADDRLFTGKKLILNLPPVQLLAIAGDFLPEETRSGLQSIVFDPAWTLLAVLEKDVPGADWPALEFSEHPVLALVSRDHTKRHNPSAPPVLIAHGNGSWSRDHLEEDPAVIQNLLLEAVQKEVGTLAVQSAQVHRWRYAQPATFFPGAFFWHADIGIGGCGDWCGKETPVHGSKVEAALESGWMVGAEAVAR
ncbi:MAG: FAD-dependent oxidoreductase [Armatimonadota bacterium]